jgi:selenocysteine lyase/cysteine desulfurase
MPDYIDKLLFCHPTGPIPYESGRRVRYTVTIPVTFVHCGLSTSRAGGWRPFATVRQRRGWGMLTRRRLLTATAGGVAALGLAGCEPDPSGSPTQAPFDPHDWASVRAQFHLAEGRANFTTFVFASHAATVRAAIDRHRAGLDADPYGYLHANGGPLDDAVLRAAATYLNTDAGQIALTDSTTMGLGLLYTGLRLRAGDEVLTTEHDFYATHESLRLREVRDGVTVRRVRLYDEPERASADEIVARFTAALRPQTRVAAITWVHSGTGVKLPVRAMADAVARANRDRAEPERILLCVDGVHGFAIEATGPADLGCDFLVSGTHKWLFGPRGTGLIWGRPAAWSRFTPVVPTFTGGPDAPAGPSATPGGYHSFEHRWALAEAFALHQAITPARVAERTHQLATAIKDGLAAIPTVRVRTPRSTELSAGIVCCEVSGYSPAEAVTRLARANVLASPTPYATSYLRFGPSILTNESDVDTALAAVRSL